MYLCDSARGYIWGDRHGFSRSNVMLKVNLWLSYKKKSLLQIYKYSGIVNVFSLRTISLNAVVKTRRLS